MRAHAILPAIALGLTLAAPAEAAPDELLLAIEPAYERLSQKPESQNGVGGTATAWIGLTDSLWLTFSGGAVHMLDTSADDETLTRWEAFGGITAAFDVFRVVPSLELLAGVVGAKSDVHPTIRIGGAVDYLLTPEWSLGVALRLRPLPEEDIATAATTAQLRIGYRFAW